MTAARLQLTIFGTVRPPPANATQRRLRPLQDFEQALCLTGMAPRRSGLGGRRENALRTYAALHGRARTGLAEAAKAGCRCSVGTHTPRDNWRYVPRKAHAVVTGTVSDDLAVLLVMSRFRKLSTTSGVQKWTYTP